MTILYIETNYLMSIATGRDRDADRLLSATMPTVRMAMPSICDMEALGALEGERKRFLEFARSLDDRSKQIRRDVMSPHAISLCEYLEQSRIKSGDQFNDVEMRFCSAMLLISARVEPIEPSPTIIRASLDNVHIKQDSKDNLILHCIIDHARLHHDQERRLLGGNSKEFGIQGVKEILREGGVSRYFTEAKTFIDWVDITPGP